MATLVRGKNKGRVATIHQICNDWATIDLGVTVVSLTSLELTPQERIIHHDALMEGTTFKVDFDYEHFKQTGRFRRIRR